MSEPRASREQAGHTQAQAALLIGVARRTLQDWEAGIAPIPTGLLRLYRHLAGIERIPFRRCG
jgi:DNA-binding XRE family transcriptional regulator